MKGIQIKHLRMKDETTGEVFMDDNKWHEGNQNLQEGQVREVRFPRSMLQSKTISRMLVFKSQEKIEAMTMAQKMYLGGQLVETLQFEFGFVMPNSENTFEQTIVADVGNVMAAEVLSGNLVCETYFYSHGQIIHKSSYKIYYD